MIELKKKDETFKISLTKSINNATAKNAQVTMSWKTGVDLDLHAYALNSNDDFMHIYFGKKESSCGNIILDQDAGVGNAAGDNEENLVVKDLTKIKKVIFVANIFRFFGNLFSSGEKFQNYDGQITIKALGEEIKIYLNSDEIGRWAVIGMIDNQNGISIFKNINAILKNQPTADYLKNLS